MIDVLLATYNGGKYLPELLESLDRQSFTDWRLIAGDDGSTDDTVALLEAWGRRNPGKLRWREGGAGLGACANFAALMDVSDAPYFMFCDQDDVWLPNKMTTLLERMRAAEEAYGRKTPIVVHSDLIVTDERLNTIRNSFWEGKKLLWPEPERPWKTLVLQNVVTGCAMIGNEALRSASLPVSSKAVMHDWWIALTAAALGRIVPCAEPTVLYRQHGANSVGFRPWGLRDLIARFRADPAGDLKHVRGIIAKTKSQAESFAELHRGSIGAEAHKYISGYGHLKYTNILRRWLFLFQNRLWFRSFRQNFGLFIFI